jgi:hypothetical protein
MGIGEVQAKGIGKNIQKNNMRIFPKSWEEDSHSGAGSF